MTTLSPENRTVSTPSGEAVLVPVVLFLTAIFLLWVCFTLRIVYVLHFSGSDISQSIHKYLRVSALTYFFSYCIAYFIVLLWVILVLSGRTVFYFPDPEDGHKGHGAIVLFTIICVTVCIGFFSYYVHLIVRLYFAFQRTTFAVSPRTIKVHVIVAGVVALLFFFLSLSYFVLRHLMRGIERDHGFDIVSLEVTAPIGILAYGLNICNVVAILGKFAHRLLSVAASRIDSFRSKASGFSPRQQALVPVAAKHGVLGFIGITAFNILIPLAMVIYVARNTVRDSHIGSFMVTFLVCIFFHTIEMVAVFLSFSFHTQQYKKVCKPCDALCMWCVSKETTRRLNRLKIPASLRSSSVASAPPQAISKPPAETVNEQALKE